MHAFARGFVNKNIQLKKCMWVGGWVGQGSSGLSHKFERCIFCFKIFSFLLGFISRLKLWNNRLSINCINNVSNIPFFYRDVGGWVGGVTLLFWMIGMFI